MEELLKSPWALVTAVAGAVILIRNGFTALLDLIKLWKAPNADQNKRLDAHEETLAELKREAKSLRERLDQNDAGSIVMYKSLLALLGHGIDGNNVQEMRDAQREIQNYLIKK